MKKMSRVNCVGSQKVWFSFVALVQKYENSPGITTGAAIGLAFGVLFLGILLTLAAVLFYNKITNTAPKYVPHHNDEWDTKLR